MGKYYNAYLKIAENPKEAYENLIQETIFSQWENTTQLRTIKEQAYPFSENYVEQEAWINSVSEISVNTNKNMSDFIEVMFKDINHPINHKGQKYLYAPKDESENVFICYDKMNPHTQVSSFKCIRCNNFLTWLDKSGNIIKEPCYIGEEITSTNNQITKDATIPNRRLICMIQGNSKTTDIKQNQRFILSHKQAFKITEMNVYSQDDINTEDVTLYSFYIEWSPLLNSDNLELNLADYYTSNYSLKINQSNLSLLPNSSGSLSATVELNGDVVNIPLKWISSDSQIIKIEDDGSYVVLGLDGQTCTITCTIQDNEQVSDFITIDINDIPISNKVLTILPNEVGNIKLNTSKQIYYGVYLNGVKQSDIVSVALGGLSSDYYSKVDITDGIEIKCLKTSPTPLQLTFTSGDLIKTMSIKLIGIL